MSYNKEVKTIEKLCNTHGLTIFVLENRGYYRCRKCRMDRAQKYRKQQRLRLIQECGGKCIRCHNADSWVLHFHHKDPSQKTFSFNHQWGNKWEILRREASKCDLLCGNCHQEVHQIIREEASSVKNAMSESVIQSRKRRKALLVEIAGGNCQLCNYKTYVGALEFHHINPLEKTFSLASDGIPRAKLVTYQEAYKCILLCTNCHRGVESNYKNISQEVIVAQQTIWQQAILEELQRIDDVAKKAICNCGSRKSRQSDVCRSCYNKDSYFKGPINPRPTKIEWPPLENLLESLETTSYRQLGKELGVSDKAIRKHIKKQQNAV